MGEEQTTGGGASSVSQQYVPMDRAVVTWQPHVVRKEGSGAGLAVAMAYRGTA